MGHTSDDSSFGISGYDLTDFIQGYQLLILEYKYTDGTTQIKYVWDRYKGVSLAPGTYTSINEPFKKIFAEFKQKYPNKVVYAPRPYQKGWMFTIDPVRDGSEEFAMWIKVGDDKANTIAKAKGYPLTRYDFATVTYLYHTKHQKIFKGYYGTYNVKEHPYFNMYLEDYLVNYPRKYPTDHTRFAYYCKDYSKIPQLYREPMLRLADLGIITPDQSALYIGVYYFNAGKTLTRAEAVQMIAKVFDKNKRDVLDEVRIKSYDYWIPKQIVGTGDYILYSEDRLKKGFINLGAMDNIAKGVIPSAPQITVRIEEPKVMSITRVNAKLYPKGYDGFGLAQQISFMESYDLAGFGIGDEGCIIYDEVDSIKVDTSDNQKTQLIDYVPLAYRDELKKDLANYTPAKVKSMSKSGEILKQYGDVYIHYKAKPIHGRIMDYELYTVIPQYKLTDKNYYPILIAKANSKYTQ
nr:hypothetical protein [Caldicellulosiruptor sp. DIB 104C]